MTTGWTPNHSNYSEDPGITNAAFNSLLKQRFWIAYGNSISYLNIPGLTIGKSYRLQLISPNPAACSVTLEGGSTVNWAGTVPSLLTLTWIAADTTANVALTRTAGEITFNGYALHDITTTAPAAPSNLAAIPSNAQIGLTWTASNGATGYKVKRSTTSGAGYVQIGIPTGTSYTDSTLVNGTTYYYVVTATNSTGESPNSSLVGATPTAALSRPRTCSPSASRRSDPPPSAAPTFP